VREAATCADSRLLTRAVPSVNNENRKKEIFHLIFDIWHLTLEESDSVKTQSTLGDFSGNDKYQFSNIK
jgi:hypothetical protein